MRIAIPVAGDEIAMHFASCKKFKFYYVEDNQIVRTFVINSGVDTVEETAKFLRMAGAQLVICGGIGGAVIKALDHEGILVMGGILGKADEKMQEFIDGTIQYSPIDPNRHHNHGGCSHHDADGEEHDCDGVNCTDCTHAADGSCH